MFFLDILTYIILIFIAFQDLKYRAVTWLLPAILFLTLILDSNFSEAFFLNALGNLMIVTFLVSFIFLYFKLRKGITFKKLFSDWLGIGDVVFFMAISPAFTMEYFVYFLTLSSLCILVVTSIIILKTKKQILIPLAGLQSIILLVILMLKNYFHFLPSGI